MPANLGPDYLAAEEEFRHAESPFERIDALEKMYAALPKHKGTEKLQADLKRRLSQARKDGQKKGVSHAPPFYLVPHEGAGQVALVGPANSGKSSLVRALTHAHPEVAPYPFTTRVPQPGMMAFEDIQIQLLDLPPVAADFTEPWMPQALSRASECLLVVDVDDPDDLSEIDYVEERLAEWKLSEPRVMVANKMDQAGSQGNLDVLQELYSGRYEFLPVSAQSGEGLPAFARRCFELLAVVRVYTKAPGKKAESGAPYVLPHGATVLDAARHVHKDFAEQLKFARLFHKSGGLDGLMVDRSHEVQDGDILEFHI
ncbi:MAG: 50S ribosome-binding GTPase [Acidobacteria bacterium]|nr:50S ribosome-binding GTPase [Acidobacteriota bacterium]